MLFFFYEPGNKSFGIAGCVALLYCLFFAEQCTECTSVRRNESLIVLLKFGKKYMPLNTHTYSNSEITVVWRPLLCKHSTLCWKGLRSVFDPLKRPWINIEGSDSQKIIEQVNKCPSGALSFFKNDVAENK